jgi:hypothetical protein
VKTEAGGTPAFRAKKYVEAAAGSPPPLISVRTLTSYAFLKVFVLLDLKVRKLVLCAAAFKVPLVWARKLVLCAAAFTVLFVFIFMSFWLTTGAPARLAFLVAFRVLIKLFFSMLMMFSPP